MMVVQICNGYTHALNFCVCVCVCDTAYYIHQNYTNPKVCTFSQKQFIELVESNIHRACTGLSLAIGYTNPWALMVRHQCDAWGGVPTGMLQLLNVFLVDIPAASCLCGKDAEVCFGLVTLLPFFLSNSPNCTGDNTCIQRCFESCWVLNTLDR